MTYTIQPLGRTVAKNTKKTESGVNIKDVNILDENILDKNLNGNIDSNMLELLSLCDSLNSLCEKLGRLDYLMKRKIIENTLNPKKQDGIL